MKRNWKNRWMQYKQEWARWTRRRIMLQLVQWMELPEHEVFGPTYAEAIQRLASAG